MDIPLHPQTVNTIANGRGFLESVRAARRGLKNIQVTVPCPDGDNTIVFDGEGMVADATFVEDIFTRYPGDKLGELLLAMSEEGYSQVSTKVGAEVSGIQERLR
ncbi:hypothetical protein BEL07_20520 [Mycolicibacterium grossiae]|uniref:Uncharacterized protein n=1 Tax=Mycolicibacterium grossiae TaxID=1552759 RepID=A0A1E8Q0B2_9MYCO|nr:hypothetical protein [Mycolicibacterium grossiae]OFJ51847.1 hypothetical protein BEL07_20520 [Mycolicibacterium grossiae]